MAYTQHVVNDMLPALASEGLVDYVDAFCEKGYFGVAETELLLDASDSLGLKSKIHVNQFNEIGGVNLCVKKRSLSVDHLKSGAESIQSLIEAGGWLALRPITYPRGTAGMQHFLHPLHTCADLDRRRVALVLATDHNPGRRQVGHGHGGAAGQLEDGHDSLGGHCGRDAERCGGDGCPMGGRLDAGTAPTSS